MRKLILLLMATLCLNANARGKFDNPDTIVVAKDGTGQFKNINEAIEVCRAFMEYHKVIYIRKGVYTEKVTIPSWLTNIELCGEDRENTKIIWYDHANIYNQQTNQPIGTFRTYTIKVQGDNITLKNLTIENAAPKLGQAVTLHTEGNHLRFINCNILGNQDTIYTGVAGMKHYFNNCLIEGTTDFIFGPGIAWFEGCELKSRVNSYVTAASTPKNQKYGYIFSNCKLTSYPGVDKVYLGRPWRAYAYTLFINCEMGKHIVSEGWQNWKDYHDPAQEGIVRYYEYNSTGEGANSEKRVAWSKQLTKKEAKLITLEEIFDKDVEWIH